MARHGDSDAEVALLLYLAGVVLVMGLSAWWLLAMMQPTPFPREGFAGYQPAERPPAVPFYRVDPAFEEAERAAVAAAEDENQRQGIEASNAFAATVPAAVAAAAPASERQSQARPVRNHAASPARAKSKRAVVRRNVPPAMPRAELASRSDRGHEAVAVRPLWPSTRDD